MIKTTCSWLAVAMGLIVASGASAQSSGLKVIDELKIGDSGSWDYVTLDSVTQTLYVAHGTEISSFNLTTGVAKPHLADATGAHIALPVHGGADLLITHGKANLITINDAASGSVKTTIPSSVKPDAAIVEPVTGFAFVMANGGNALDVIDLTSNALTKSIALDGAAEGAAVDDQGLVYTHLEDKNAFAVVDARSLKVIATHVMDDCEEPSGIAFIPEGRLILSACKNGIARISSAETGAEIATVPIGPRPDAALYNPTSRQGYIPTFDGELTVISFDGTPHVVDTVTTKAGARTATLDPQTGRIYLPTAELGAVDAKTGRPAIVPDTFEVLVVGK